jgi:hypothetical protein
MLDPVTEALLKKLKEEDDMGDANDINPLNHPIVKVAKKIIKGQVERPIRIGGSVR